MSTDKNEALRARMADALIAAGLAYRSPLDGHLCAGRLGDSEIDSDDLDRMASSLSTPASSTARDALRPSADWYRRKITEADDLPCEAGGPMPTIYVCSNPSRKHQYAADPMGHCPDCQREGVGNWSCTPETLTPLPSAAEPSICSTGCEYCDEPETEAAAPKAECCGDPYLREIVKDEFASALLAAGIQFMPAGYIDAVADEVLRRAYNPDGKPSASSSAAAGAVDDFHDRLYGMEHVLFLDPNSGDESDANQVKLVLGGTVENVAYYHAEGAALTTQREDRADG